MRALAAAAVVLVVAACGAVLNLTTSVMADRVRTAYGDQVQPDEVIADRNELALAVAWLQTGR